MGRYAVVKDGKVINVIVWDPDATPSWKPLEGEAVPYDGRVEIGFDYTNGQFVDNRPQLPDTDLSKVKEQYIARIDMVFRTAVDNMFVDAAKREELRLKAVAAANAVTASTSIEDATVAMEQGLAKLKE